MSQTIKKINPCIPQKVIHPYSPVAVETDEDKYIFTRELKDIVKKTGDDETDFVLDHKVVETSKVNRQEYIESFRDDVGILNIMKKVALTEDTSLINQRVRNSLPLDEDGVEKVVDITGLGDQEAAKNYLLNVQQILEQMDPELREAVSTMSGEELKNYLASKAQTTQTTQTTEKKDGE